jgi:hypothetical protein
MAAPLVVELRVGEVALGPRRADERGGDGVDGDPVGADSTARHFVRWEIAAFVVQYTDSVRRATRPACEPRLTMRP